MWKTIFRVMLGVAFVCLLVGCTALLATVFSTRLITSAIERSLPESQRESAPELASPVSLDFYEAADIPEAELQRWFADLNTRPDQQQVRVIVTLQNDDGRYLIDSPIGLREKDGTKWIPIGSSGTAEFALSPPQLPGLTLVVPEEFRHLKQRTFPIGSRYEKPPEIDPNEDSESVVNDDRIQQELVRNLQRVRSTQPIRNRIDAEDGLTRPVFRVRLPETHADRITPEHLYQMRMPSVVVVGFLKPNGEASQGTGFVLDQSGIVVTNFHVVDKPDAVAGGVLTADHKFYEIRKILAGNSTDDLALIQVDCKTLTPIPLAQNNSQVAAEVFAISHPHSNYFSLTHGRVTRYFRRVRHAYPSVRLGVTTEFAEGSSGGPLMDNFGNVTGILSATVNEQGQMLHREAIPVSALRRMVGELNGATGPENRATVTSLKADF